MILLIFLVVGISVYFYYNYKCSLNKNNSRKTSYSNTFNSLRVGNPISYDNNMNSKKRVRFNDNVKYNTYKYNTSSVNYDSPDSKINFDILSSSDRISENPLKEISSDNTSMTASSVSEHHVYPSNYNQTNPEELWDSNFGVPLIDKKNKERMVKKINREHRRYGKSLGNFIKYKTDDSTIIKTDITIDPFKNNASEYNGKSIREIYDRQVAGPKAKPKRILKRTPNRIIYEDESEMNGGLIKGTTNLRGFECGINNYKDAAFDDEF